MKNTSFCYYFLPPDEGTNSSISVMKFNARVFNFLSGGSLFKAVFNMRRRIDDEVDAYETKLSDNQINLKRMRSEVIDEFQGRDTNFGALPTKRFRSKFINYLKNIENKDATKKSERLKEALKNSAEKGEFEILKKFR